MGRMNHLGTRGAAEKPNDFTKTIKRLLQYCNKYLPAIVMALVFAAIGTVLQIIGPDKIKVLAHW